MTIYEASLEQNWEEIGIANVLVSRRRDDGYADFALFLVDTFCLGVKDVLFMPEMSAEEEREFVTKRLPSEDREAMHPACAKKLIEGAITYAQSLGFAPHRNYRKARKVLSGIDASLCPREFIYGSDGRPCYVRGADDSDRRIDRVLAILEARFGETGFDYEDPYSGDSTEVVRDALKDWLEEEPDGVPRFFEVSGLITAMQLCPTVLTPTKLMNVLWGKEGRAWNDEDEMKDFLSLLMEYWNLVATLVNGALATDPVALDTHSIIDIWEGDFGYDDEDGYAMAAISIEWATGFLRATEIWPEAWDDALRRPDLVPHWETVQWWRGFDVQENRDKIVAESESENPRTINHSVKALARALRNPSA